MIPIYEQGAGKGVGHSIESFMSTFSRKLATDRKEKSFAFIFYDFQDTAFKKRLKEIDFFAKLDRTASIGLDIFYLHSGGKSTVEQFNAFGHKVLGLSQSTPLPSIVLFRASKKDLEEITVLELSSVPTIQEVDEVCQCLIDYKEHKDSSLGKRVILGAKYIGSQLFSAALGTLLGKLF